MLRIHDHSQNSPHLQQVYLAVFFEVSVACMINIIIHWLYSACNYYHWPEEFAYLRARIRPHEFEVGNHRGIYSCIMRNEATSSVELEIGEIGTSTHL